MEGKITVKPSRRDLAIKAKQVMDNLAGSQSDSDYTELLVAIQTGNRVKFEEICNARGIKDKDVKELWAAAVGCMSLEAQAAYPGSSGW